MYKSKNFFFTDAMLQVTNILLPKVFNARLGDFDLLL